MRLQLDSGPIPLHELYLAATDSEYKQMPRILSIQIFPQEEAEKFFEDVWDKHHLFNITLTYSDKTLVPGDKYTELFIYAMKEFFENNIKIKLYDSRTRFGEAFSYKQLAPLIRQDIEQFPINTTYISVDES